MLKSTKEIAELYNVSSWTITHDWCKNGLKHTKAFKYKVEWVDEFLEETAIQNYQDKQFIRPTKKLTKRNLKKITLEELEVI